MRPYLHPKLHRVYVKYANGSVATYYSTKTKINLFFNTSAKDVFNHDLWRSKHIKFFFIDKNV